MERYLIFQFLHAELTTCVAIVKNAEELEKHTRGLQEAIWEFISTERSYILILKLAVDVYIAVLLELQQRGYLNTVNIVDLFGNIKELYSIHLDYWTTTITPVLNSFRSTRQPLHHGAVNELYDQLADRLQKPYLRYLQNASESIDYGRELTTRSAEFTRYAEWCQRQRPIRVAGNSSVIQNLSLDSIQSNPHQRITRYGILLDSIVKRSTDKDALYGTCKRVETLCRWLNNRVKLGELEKRIKTVSFAHFKVSSTQVDHELTRLKEIKSSFDLKAPIPSCQAAIKREVFTEMDQITMRHGELQKAVPVVVCILTDVLLVCQTPAGKQANRLMKELVLCRAPMRTDRLNPIQSNILTRLFILSLTEYGCPDGCFQFDFQTEQSKTQFLSKLDEARKTYKAIQQGQTAGEDALNQLDRNFQSNQIDSDPDSPDECVIGGGAIHGPDNQLLEMSSLTVNAEAALLGFGAVDQPVVETETKKKKKGLFRFKKSKKLYQLDD